jgi:hypothetical protein
MRPEEWKVCADYPVYEVSSLGRVRRRYVMRGKPPCILKPWANNKLGYQVVGLSHEGRKVRVFVHRLVGKAFYGLTDDREIDHRFHDPTDNINIRTVTRAQNVRSAHGRRRSTSQFKGVSWCAKRGLWYACIRLNGKTKSLGCFANEDAAARAYDRAAFAAWGQYAFINFPFALGLWPGFWDSESLGVGETVA